jgi:hypothetical protein
VRLHGRALAPPGTRLLLRRNGAVAASSTGLSVSLDVDRREAPVAYRLEVEWADATSGWAAPWVVSNAITIGSSIVDAAAAATTRVPSSLGTSASASTEVGRFAGWRVEKDAITRASVAATSGSDGLALEFRLASAGRSTWAAAAAALPPGLGVDDELRFSAQANRPLRLSVQARAPGGSGEQRWRRSVYLDETRRDIVVPLRTLTPVGKGPVQARLSQSDKLLLVIDRTHAVAGASGRILFEDIRLVRP